MKINAIYVIIALLSFIVILAGCGQKGDLVRPLPQEQKEQQK